MESPLSIFRMHWDHEPRMHKSLEIKPGILRFMESPQSQKMVAHWDHEPRMHKSLEIKPGILRFMESLDAKISAYWDHEPASTEFLLQVQTFRRGS
jgi:hypothetical protein